jgi:hypothetical protein
VVKLVHVELVVQVGMKMVLELVEMVKPIKVEAVVE